LFCFIRKIRKNNFRKNDLVPFHLLSTLSRFLPHLLRKKESLSSKSNWFNIVIIFIVLLQMFNDLTTNVSSMIVAVWVFKSWMKDKIRMYNSLKKKLWCFSSLYFQDLMKSKFHFT
jgi:hypothetical protein